MTYLEMFKAEAMRINAEIRRKDYKRREAERNRRYRKEHRAELTAYRKAWMARNGFDENAYMREWHRKHPGKHTEYSRRHRAKAKEAAK